MRRGTTPDYILSVSGGDLSGCAVYVTISQAGRRTTLTGERLTIAVDDSTGRPVTSIRFRLTQAETLAMQAGKASVQVRWTDAGGLALATEIKTIGIMPVLLEEVIAYDGTSDGDN